MDPTSTTAPIRDGEKEKGTDLLPRKTPIRDGEKENETDLLPSKTPTRGGEKENGTDLLRRKTPIRDAEKENGTDLLPSKTPIRDGEKENETDLLPSKTSKRKSKKENEIDLPPNKRGRPPKTEYCESCKKIYNSELAAIEQENRKKVQDFKEKCERDFENLKREKDAEITKLREEIKCLLAEKEKLITDGKEFKRKGIIVFTAIKNEFKEMLELFSRYQQDMVDLFSD